MLRKSDLCLSLQGFPAAHKQLLSFVFKTLFTRAQQYSVSFLQVSAANRPLKDLFGAKKGGKADSVVTGIKATSVKQAMEALLRFAPDSLDASDTLVLTATCVLGNGTKSRMHVTFGQAGGWKQSLKMGTGNLLFKLVQRCPCVRICDEARSDFVAEWRQLFPRSDLTELEQAQAKIAKLEEQLKESNRRIAIRENTIVNVVISTHPVFQGLADYPRREKRTFGEIDKENGLQNRGVVFHSSVADNAQPPTKTARSAKKPPQMLRSLSNSSGAVRVAKSGATPGRVSKSSATPGRTPGRTAGQTPGPPKTRSRIY
jgi:hypothetical protein